MTLTGTSLGCSLSATRWKGSHLEELASLNVQNPRPARATCNFTGLWTSSRDLLTSTSDWKSQIETGPSAGQSVYVHESDLLFLRPRRFWKEQAAESVLHSSHGRHALCMKKNEPRRSCRTHSPITGRLVQASFRLLGPCLPWEGYGCPSSNRQNPQRAWERHPCLWAFCYLENHQRQFDDPKLTSRAPAEPV